MLFLLKDIKNYVFVNTGLGHVATIIFWLSRIQSFYMLRVTSLTSHDER